MRKNLVIITVMILTLVTGLVGVYADTPPMTGEDALSESVIAEALKTLDIAELEVAPGTKMNIVRNATSTGVIAIARNYDELLNALAAENVDGVYLVNDIYLEDALEIDKDFSFESLFDNTKIFSALGKRHILVTAAEITLDLGNIVLDGGFDNAGYPNQEVPETGGGILAKETLTVTGGTIQNCRINNQGGAALSLISDWGVTEGEFRVINCNVLDNFSSVWGAIYVNRPLTIENCTISNNISGDQGVTGCAITARNSLYMRNCELTENINGSIISFYSVDERNLDMEIYDTIFAMNDTKSLSSVIYASTIYYEHRDFDSIVLKNVEFNQNKTAFNSTGI